MRGGFVIVYIDKNNIKKAVFFKTACILLNTRSIIEPEYYLTVLKSLHLQKIRSTQTG